MKTARFVLAALLVAGCSGEADDSIGPAAEDELRAMSLTIAGDQVTDSPPLVPGASGALACGDRFEGEGGVRSTCTRGKEILELIRPKDGGKAVVVHRPQGRSKDTRTFFTCEGSGDRLTCASKVAKAGGGGGGLASPFASTVPGLAIANAHPVGASGLLFRGMAPDTAKLQAFGVGAVLIFKNETGHEVADEKAAIGFASVLDVPFQWKGLTTWEEPCGQVVDALAFLDAQTAAQKKTYFHCTVGEDRTGLLAAVARLAHEPDLDPARAFDLEMCERGYGAGNPLKPGFVVGQVEANLTPLYQKLAFVLAKGELTKAACKADPSSDPTFASKALDRQRLRCGTSTAFRP